MMSTEPAHKSSQSKHIYHSNFKSEKHEILNQHVKSLMLDSSSPRHQDYKPAKIFVRTDNNYVCRDSKEIASEKYTRKLVSSIQVLSN